MRLESAGVCFGRYRLMERVGQGGMAEVFRATRAAEPDGGVDFVIKRIRPDRSDSPKFVQMFCDEAQISALLSHPNIVRVYDFGQIDGAYFMAMEYLDGWDLSAVLGALRGRRAALPAPVAALVAREAARALEHAHTATLPNGEPGGIVHRDVSPSNIMLLRSGEVKILDFGIAKAAALARPADEGSGKHPKLQGHLAYLSPELIRGTEVDRRSDLFSLGVVLWEMVAGQHLFAGKDEFETMRNVLRRPVRAPSRSRVRVPEALDAILERALDRDPADRYQTAAAMADDLDRFLIDAPCASSTVAALLEQLFDDAAPDRTHAAAGPIEVPSPPRRPARGATAGLAALLAALLAGWLARGGCSGGGAAAAGAPPDNRRTPALGAGAAARDQSSSARSVSTSR